MSLSLDAAPRAPASSAEAVAAPPLETELVPGACWDAAIADFDTICQEQLHVFASTRWPGTAPEPLLFRAGGEIVGGALVLIQRLPLGLASIAVVKWGPMLRRAAAPDAMEVYAGMVEALVARYGRQRGMMVSILPQASVAPGHRELDHLYARGFAHGSTLLFPNRYLVDLRQDDAMLKASFEQKWRYHLNKSLKAGLEFRRAGPEELPAFDALYRAMSDRKQFSDHSAYETVPALMAIADDLLRPELFFVTHEGETVAGAIIFAAGERAVYLYGATSDAALPLRAGYFLHWQVIRWLRDNTRARWYDLGGTDGFQGLHQFKKGMVGSAGVISPVPPVANYATRPLAFVLGQGAFAARDLAHDLKRRIGWALGRARPSQQLVPNAADPR